MTTALSDRTHAVRPPARSTGSDIWSGLAIAVAATLLVGATRAIGDPDIWWHVRTGRLILRHGVPSSEPWAFTAIGNRWTPTSWLSDVTLAVIQEGFGWRGIILFKVILGVVLFASLFRLLFSAANPRLAAPVFILTALTLSPFVAERPQLISLCFVVWLAAAARRITRGATPPWWAIAVTFAWANLHGMWILSPLCFGIAALGVAADRGANWRARTAKTLAVAVGCIGVSALTPAGPRLVVSPLIVRQAAGDVSEWQPTNLLDHYTVFLLVLVLVWALSAARGSIPTPRSELVWMGLLFVFTLVAARNIAPAAILMSPFVLAALTRTYSPHLARAGAPPDVSQAAIWTLVVLASCFAGVLIAVRPPLISGLPANIVAELRSRPGQVHVFNSYAVGGYLTGEGAPQVSVAIDGRTENYDPAFVHRYFQATTKMVGWRSLIADLNPDVAVIGANSQLADELRRIGWRESMTDGEFVLLDHPVRTP